MGASVEARVSFVDHRLVEFAFQLSKNLKMSWKDTRVYDKPGQDSSEVNDTPKWVLKRAVSEYIDGEIIERKKLCFPVPLNHWNKSNLFDEMKLTVVNGKLIEKGIINRNGLINILSEVDPNNNILC